MLSYVGGRYPIRIMNHMGKATIQEHYGEGLYQVAYLQNVAEIETAITQKLLDITYTQDVEIPAAQALFDAARAIQVEKKAWLNTAIATGTQKEITAATAAVNFATIDVGKFQTGLSRAQLKLTSLQSELKYLQDHIPAEKLLDLWCADANTGLTGDVGTMELKGEYAPGGAFDLLDVIGNVPELSAAAGIFIKPGGDIGNQSGYDAAADGILTPSMALSPAENFYNLAMLPGWQKWQPKYRVGVITAIDNDVNTCDVTLDEALSSQQYLDVNQALIYENVPVEYMRCHSGAFRVGDRVVVKFERNLLNLTAPLDYRPKVIGFEANPKACRCKYLYTFDLYFNRARRYAIVNGTTPTEDGYGNYYTPTTIEKKYNGATYTLHTSPSAPKLVIKSVEGIETEYPLPPIGNVFLSGYSTPEYDVKRLEIKNDKIYIHDYKYAIPLGGDSWQSLANPPGAYGRIKTYHLDMTVIGTETIELPDQIVDAYIAVDGYPEDALIYVLPQSFTASDWRIYVYDREWTYQGKEELAFRPSTGQALSGWKKDRIYIGSQATEAVPQAYLYCYDANWNQIWRVEVPGVQAIACNGDYMAVSTGTIGTILLLDAATGTLLATYNMPVVSNPGHSNTEYSAHRLAVFENKLYVGIQLREVWSGKSHPRAYIFDITEGNFDAKQQGTYIQLARYWSYGQWTDIYYTVMGALAVATCKEGWWLALQESDAYAWWLAAWDPPGTMVEEENHIDEAGGMYLFEAGGFNQIGHIQHYAPAGSEVF